MAVGIFAGCQPSEQDSTAGKSEWVDYVAQTTLDMNSDTLKQEVTIYMLIDGDTTHFNVPRSISENGVMKARYAACDTPESTGQIEPYGKKASNFTKEKLSNADSIIVESTATEWKTDSSGSRIMAWIWYRPKGESQYRNLNLELVQEGLSHACGGKDDRYGDASAAAYLQAKEYQLNIFSGEKDPDFYYGEAIEVDLKELRTHIEQYENKTVIFEGVITRNNSQTIYVEAFDEETEMYFGMNVYYGFNSGIPASKLKPGNLVHIVGSVQQFSGSWQVSNLTYSQYDKNDPGNFRLLETDQTVPYTTVDPAQFVNGKMTFEVHKAFGSEEMEEKEFRYAELIMSTSVAMNDLYVEKIYTTNNGGDNDGAMTLTCKAADGTVVTIRTTVLKKEDGQLYTAEDFLNKTIDVTGTVDCYNGEYQIKVFSANNITVHE